MFNSLFSFLLIDIPTLSPKIILICTFANAHFCKQHYAAKINLFSINEKNLMHPQSYKMLILNISVNVHWQYL